MTCMNRRGSASRPSRTRLPPSFPPFAFQPEGRDPSVNVYPVTLFPPHAQQGGDVLELAAGAVAEGSVLPVDQVDLPAGGRIDDVEHPTDAHARHGRLVGSVKPGVLTLGDHAPELCRRRERAPSRRSSAARWPGRRKRVIRRCAAARPHVAAPCWARSRDGHQPVARFEGQRDARRRTQSSERGQLRLGRFGSRVVHMGKLSWPVGVATADASGAGHRLASFQL